MATRPTRRVLGIDPGSLRLGWGLVVGSGPALRREDGGVIRPPRDAPLEQRLRHQHLALAEILDRLKPDEIAVEAGYGARHARAALVLGQARGAVLLTVALAGHGLVEYPPALVKKTVTGTGAADKEQVRKLVALLLGGGVEVANDESDALAVAICHHQLGAARQRLGPLAVAAAAPRRRGAVLADWRARARPAGAPKRRIEDKP